MDVVKQTCAWSKDVGVVRRSWAWSGGCGHGLVTLDCDAEDNIKHSINLKIKLCIKRESRKPRLRALRGQLRRGECGPLLQ